MADTTENAVKADSSVERKKQSGSSVGRGKIDRTFMMKDGWWRCAVCSLDLCAFLSVFCFSSLSLYRCVSRCASRALSRLPTCWVSSTANPFSDLKLSQAQLDEMASRPGRVQCPKCNKKYKFYCYNCRIGLTDGSVLFVFHLLTFFFFFEFTRILALSPNACVVSFFSLYTSLTLTPVHPQVSNSRLTSKCRCVRVGVCERERVGVWM
jgi:hypothetical protein